MLKLLIFLAVTTLALSDNSEDDDRIIDLQELLRNVSDSYRDLGQSMKELSQNADRNVRNLSDSLLLVIKNANENAMRAEKIAKFNAQRAEANAEKADQHMKENTDILKLILKVLADKQEGSTQSTVVTEYPCTVVTEPTAQGKDCADLYTLGKTTSGVYNITVPSIGTFQVFCDMTTDGGGWTVFQRRGDFGNPQDYFYRNWTDYKHGFGELTKEFWLGNDRVSAMSQPGSYLLRIDLADMEGETRYAKYQGFRLENESYFYILRIGKYTGSAGDSLIDDTNQAFSTKDKDNGASRQGCAVTYQGAWWYRSCGYSSLNSLNLRGPDPASKGIYWYHWKRTGYSLPFTEMKMRPGNF